jgi:hypothetical protein
MEPIVGNVDTELRESVEFTHKLPAEQVIVEARHSGQVQVDRRVGDRAPASIVSAAYSSAMVSTSS